MRELRENFHTHDHGTAHMPPSWMLFPAYTVLPFLRRPLGYAIIYPWHFLVSLGMVAFVGFMLVPFIPAAALGPLWLTWFACASFALSCVIFAARLIGRRRGERLHTHNAGYSHLTLETKLPVWLCEQVLIPLLLGGVGWILAHRLSYELGWWLILCGFSYCLMSNWEGHKRAALDRQIINDMARGQVFGDRVDANQTGTTGSPGLSRASWGAGQQDDEQAAELGRHPRKPSQSGAGRSRATSPDAAGPDAAGWSGGSDSLEPAFVTWFRRRRQR